MSEIALNVRRAVRDDLPVILDMLADDALTQARGHAVLEVSAAHLAAFAEIDADPNQFLAIAMDGEAVVGTFQLTFIPGLSRGGARSALIEAVRIAGRARGRGVGAAMLGWVVQECRRRGCADIQLTSDLSRIHARRFYERLGFVASHAGMKLKL